MSTKTRGFASMDPAYQRELASRGGKAAHVLGKAHRFTPDEARRAGKQGGTRTARDREHMAMIGRKGGHASGVRRKVRAITERG